MALVARPLSAGNISSIHRQARSKRMQGRSDFGCGAWCDCSESNRIGIALESNRIGIGSNRNRCESESEQIESGIESESNLNRIASESNRIGIESNRNRIGSESESNRIGIESNRMRIESHRNQIGIKSNRNRNRTNRCGALKTRPVGTGARAATLDMSWTRSKNGWQFLTFVHDRPETKSTV